MLPTINGKALLDCNIDDLREILNNPDYRENEYIDYKGVFMILQRSGKDREEEKAEFRSDVCAFANANGGYLIFGVKEDGKGVPLEFTGVSINNDNTDRFELDIRNWLQPISPRIPYYRLSFIKLDAGKYIVIMLVKNDSFAPYIHLENEKDYRIYKRIGNSKATIAYSELKNMFMQSFALEKEIERLRKERIDYYLAQRSNTNRFLLLQIIPDTFADTSYNQLMFALERKGMRLSEVFDGLFCGLQSFPMVEGIRFPCVDGNQEGRLYNNGIAEAYYPLDGRIVPHSNGGEILCRNDVWDSISFIVNNYSRILSTVLSTERVYICITIVGCKSVCTDDSFTRLHLPTIDREHLMISPMVFENIRDCVTLETDLKHLKLEYLLSLGVRDRDVTSLTKELYGV